MDRIIEFPFFQVQDTWERRHEEKYGTVAIIPLDIRLELKEKCPEVSSSWYIFARDYQTMRFPEDTVTEIYQRLNLLYRGSDYGIRCMDWINCIVKQPGFDLGDKWKIIGWLFSLLFEEVPKFDDLVVHLNR